MIVSSMEAMPIEVPGQKEKKYAYSVTFKAVMDEKDLGMLTTCIRDHKVLAHVKRIEEGT